MIKQFDYKLIEYISAFLFFLTLRPSFAWSMSHIVYMTLLFLVLLPKINLREKNNSALFLMFFVILCIVPVMHGSKINTFLYYTMFSIVPFLKRKFAMNTFHVFRIGLAVITAISLIVWFLVVILQIDLPHSVIAPLNSLKSYKYLSYPLLVIPQIYGDPLFAVRFCCVFDEPGAIGTYSLLILYIGNFNFKKWYNVIYLIAGILSYSLFFYVGLVIFVLFRVFTIQSQKKYRYWAIAGVALLYVGAQTIPILSEKIGTRLEYDEERGRFVGDNRTSKELDDYIESIEGSRAYVWGEKKEIVEHFNSSASIKNAILRYGMVFILLFFLFFFFYARSYLKGNRTELFLFMLLLYVTLYQRPAFVSPAYLFMFSIVVITRYEELRSNSVAIGPVREYYEQ